MVVCGDRVRTPGIDVSGYNPGTQWGEVARGGIKFTFVKATEGSSYTNKLFASDWPKAKAAGVLRGAYHYFHPGVSPVDQAKYFLKTVGPLASNDLPMMLDWEEADGVSAKQQVQNAKIWLQAVEKETGKIPIIYTSPSFWNDLGNPQGFDRYSLFIAHYNTSCPEVPPPWSTWTFWQMGGGSQMGVQTSEVDHNVFNGPLFSLSLYAAAKQTFLPFIVMQ
jgi:lysozyme